MPTSQTKCCSCGCQGTNCYRGFKKGCTAVCCFCKGLIGLDTCDDAYWAAYNACISNRDGHSESDASDWCSSTVSVAISSARSGMTSPLSYSGGCNGAPIRYQDVDWTKTRQITNSLNGLPAENAGDAPFIQPCSNSTVFTCNTLQSGTCPDGDTEQLCNGDPVPFNSTCWEDCPQYGNMWKPEHYETEEVSSWPGLQSLYNLTLIPQGGCRWENSYILSGEASRIWLQPVGSVARYDSVPTWCESCDNCEGTVGSNDCSDCCFCKPCTSVWDPAYDCTTDEAGCITGFCMYQVPETDPWPVCADNQEQFLGPQYQDGGYTKTYIDVKYVLTYSLHMIEVNSDLQPAQIPSLKWVHRISLTPYYMFPGSSLTVTGGVVSYSEGTRPSTGDWAEMIDEWGTTSLIDCGGGCTGTDNACPAEGFATASSINEWTRCEWVQKNGIQAGGISECNRNNCAHSRCDDGWCDGGGPNYNNEPFWSEVIDYFITTPIAGCTCTNVDMNENCSQTVYYSGKYFNGLVMEYDQVIEGELQCSNGCPVPTSFSKGGWSVTMSVS